MNLFSTTWVKISGTKYTTGMVLMINHNDQCPTFGRIKDICINECDKVYFCIIILNIVAFSEHLQAYAVDESIIWDLVSLII